MERLFDKSCDFGCEVLKAWKMYSKVASTNMSCLEAHTLLYLIDVHARLLILIKNSPLHGLIWVCTFIDSEKKIPPACLFKIKSSKLKTAYKIVKKSKSVINNSIEMSK